MKHSKNIIFPFLLLFVWTMLHLCSMTATASTVHLKTTVPHYISLTVEINGKGTLHIGEQKIDNSQTISVSRNEQIVIDLEPAEGYTFLSAKLNGEYIDSMIKDGQITVNSPYQNYVLIITFVKKDGSITNNNPSTGDNTIGCLVAMVIVTFVSLAIMVSRRHKY